MVTEGLQKCSKDRFRQKKKTSKQNTVCFKKAWEKTRKRIKTIID